MKKDSGFSIWELIAPLVLIAIMTSLMLPSFGTVMNEQRIRQLMSELRMGISIARSEGVKRSNFVAFVPNVSWSKGWCVEVDPSATTCSSHPLHMFIAENGNSVLSASSKVMFNDWGRTESCPKFTIVRNNCSMCISVTADGRVMSTAGVCPTSCPSSSNETAWSQACQ